jgi:hypothetical protein
MRVVGFEPTTSPPKRSVPLFLGDTRVLKKQIRTVRPLAIGGILALLSGSALIGWTATKLSYNFKKRSSPDFLIFNY